MAVLTTISAEEATRLADEGRADLEAHAGDPTYFITKRDEMRRDQALGIEFSDARLVWHELLEAEQEKRDANASGQESPDKKLTSELKAIDTKITEIFDNRNKTTGLTESELDELTKLREERMNLTTPQEKPPAGFNGVDENGAVKGVDVSNPEAAISQDVLGKIGHKFQQEFGADTPMILNTREDVTRGQIDAEAEALGKKFGNKIRVVEIADDDDKIRYALLGIADAEAATIHINSAQGIAEIDQIQAKQTEEAKAQQLAQEQADASKRAVYNAVKAKCEEQFRHQSGSVSKGIESLDRLKSGGNTQREITRIQQYGDAENRFKAKEAKAIAQFNKRSETGWRHPINTLIRSQDNVEAKLAGKLIGALDRYNADVAKQDAKAARLQNALDRIEDKIGEKVLAKEEAATAHQKTVASVINSLEPGLKGDTVAMIGQIRDAMEAKGINVSVRDAQKIVVQASAPTAKAPVTANQR